MSKDRRHLRVGPASAGWLLRVGLAIGAAGCATSTVVPAVAAGDAAAGRQLARQWCSSCHAVESVAQASDAAPPLATIAERHRGNLDWVRAWLEDPHPPMPNFNLSRTEIDDIVAYLSGLASQ